MNRKQFIFTLCLLFCSVAVVTPVRAQEAMNRPYVDDQLFHFGFQLGMNFGSFGVTNAEIPVKMEGQMDTIHARVSSLMPGFHLGFITDLRLCRYLNLRFCPGLMFSMRTIDYKSASGRPVKDLASKSENRIDVLTMPLNLPLYLKWSAAREGNYRPYVIAGGGFSVNLSHFFAFDKPILLNKYDYFAEIGFGCDFYHDWFKFCPEITYRIGFANQLCPSDKHPGLGPDDTRAFYTDAISRLTSHTICLTFNFE